MKKLHSDLWGVDVHPRASMWLNSEPCYCLIAMNLHTHILRPHCIRHTDVHHLDTNRGQYQCDRGKPVIRGPCCTARTGRKHLHRARWKEGDTCLMNRGWPGAPSSLPRQDFDNNANRNIDFDTNLVVFIRHGVYNNKSKSRSQIIWRGPDIWDCGCPSEVEE